MIPCNSTARKAILETSEPIAHIRLYVAGATPSSQRARNNLRAAVETVTNVSTKTDVEIIDVFEGPKRAIADGIFVTPTLVVQVSNRMMMMVGDLSDAAALEAILVPAFVEVG